jgi:nitroreductase
MSTVSTLVAKRHTTRLMVGEVRPEDQRMILETARRAPSKNKIYGYKVFVLGNNEQCINLKQELCDHVTLYKEDDGKTIYLMQTLAPLVLIYMTNPAPEHQMVQVKESVGTEVFDRAYSEVKGQADKYAMVKSSVRDAMISATYAQLCAEDLGYGTAFVACGLEDIMQNVKFKEIFSRQFGADFASQPIEPVVILCIGPKDDHIKRLYSGETYEWRQDYRDGETHYKRSGREESFFVNQKQETMFVTL